MNHSHHNHDHHSHEEHGHNHHNMAISSTMPDQKKLKTYLPLILILGFIVFIDAAWQYFTGGFSWATSMRVFMGLFFLLFGFFKTLDWSGFAHAYAEYDIIAKKSKAYSYAYPVIELSLGFLYLFNISPLQTNIAAAIVMFIGSIGILKALLGKRKIRCACLGTVVKLPMTTVTLIEDVGMGVMALAMIYTLV